MQSFTNSRHVIYVCLSFSSVCLTSTEKLYKDLKFWFPSLKTPTISHFSNIKSTWIQNQQKPHPRFTTLRPRRRVLDLVANAGLPIKLLPNVCFIVDSPSCIKDFLIVIEQQEADLIKKQKEERRALREKKALQKANKLANLPGHQQISGRLPQTSADFSRLQQTTVEPVEPVEKVYLLCSTSVVYCRAVVCCSLLIVLS